MPFEDIEIRIARDGTVFLHVDGVSEDRIRSLREFLEEEIGPIKAMEVIRKPDWDMPAHRAAEGTSDQADELKLGRKR